MLPIQPLLLLLLLLLVVLLLLLVARAPRVLFRIFCLQRLVLLEGALMLLVLRLRLLLLLLLVRFVLGFLLLLAKWQYSLPNTSLFF